MQDNELQPLNLQVRQGSCNRCGNRCCCALTITSILLALGTALCVVGAVRVSEEGADDTAGVICAVAGALCIALTILLACTPQLWTSWGQEADHVRQDLGENQPRRPH